MRESKVDVYKFWLLTAALAFSCGLAGCRMHFSQLKGEDSVPELAELKALAASHPAKTMRFAAADGLQLSAREAGNGRSERVVVLLHGVLSDNRMWRYVEGALGGDCDVLSIDLPGCGRSDCPDPSVAANEVYAPGGMARSVLEVIRQYVANRIAPTRITLVGHSLGGAIILRMFGDNRMRAEYAGVLARVDGLVLFAPADAMIDPHQPVFRAVADATDLQIGLASSMGILLDRPLRVGNQELNSDQRIRSCRHPAATCSVQCSG